MKRSLTCAALAALTLVLWAGTQALAQEPDRDPRRLMRALVNPPPAYRGLRSVTMWSPTGCRTVEFMEFREGPNVRMEVRPTVESGPTLVLGGPAQWRIYQPDFRSVVQTDFSPRMVEARLEQAFRSYAWSVVGEESMAGRPAVVLEARATYPGGLRNRFWIDLQHPQVLRREKYDPQDRLLFRSTFTTIDYPADIEDRLFEGPGGEAVSREDGGIPAEDDPDFLPRIPEKALPGFVTERAVDLDPTMAGWDGHHTVYSDGLECVSLFQFPGGEPVELGASSFRVSIDRCPARMVQGTDGNMVTWSDGQRAYLVISALPREAVAPVVRQLAPADPPSQGLLFYLKRGWRKVLSLVGLG